MPCISQLAYSLINNKHIYQLAPIFAFLIKRVAVKLCVNSKAEYLMLIDHTGCHPPAPPPVPLEPERGELCNGENQSILDSLSSHMTDGASLLQRQAFADERGECR